MARLPRLPVPLNWMADESVQAREIPRSDYIPLKDIECCKCHGIHENHGGDAKQDAFQLCDWKYSTIESQSKIDELSARSQTESDGSKSSVRRTWSIWSRRWPN